MQAGICLIMIDNLILKFQPLMKEVGLSFHKYNGKLDRESIESFVHETAHIITLFGAEKTEALLRKHLRTQEPIMINSLIKNKLKTVKAQDLNEIKTTAVTILAMDQLGGGTFYNSMNSMVGNLQEDKKNIPNQFYYNKCVEFMMTDNILHKANKLAKMLLQMEFDLQWLDN